MKIKTIVKFLFILSAFIIIFNKIDLNELKSIKLQSPFFLFLAFIMFNLSQIISAIRIQNYLSQINITPRLSHQLILYYIGMFYNTLLPGGIGGDGLKAYTFEKEFKKGYKAIIKALLIDRLSGLFAILFLVGVLLLFTRFYYFALFIVIIPFILYFTHKLFFKEFTKVSFKNFIISLIIQTLQGISFIFIIKSLGIDTHLVEFAILFFISSVVSVVPISIGGVGLRELTFLYGLNILGLNPAVGVVGAFLFFIITILSSLIGAFFKIPQNLTNN
jgi:uncharacterized membrane protein YbhN (UPF0104 family)